ncbi:MAG: type II toxin-antitoxin system VapC family toxin [Bryobacteraceae bacterium]
MADASLGLAWSVKSQADGHTERLRDEAIKGVPVIVPALWALEVSNGLLMLVRRGRVVPSGWAEAVRLSAQMNFTVDEEAHTRAFTAILDLAMSSGLTVYDATYLELAKRRGLPLASRDGALKKAAKKCGVKTLL